MIVELRLASGALGRGEAAPLPGMSRDTLDDAQRAIDALARRLPLDLGLTRGAPAIERAGGDLAPDDLGHIGDLAAGDIVAQVAQLVASTTAAPAARFALETALLSALAVERGLPLAALLAEAPATRVPFAVVADTPAEARGAWIKIKVGPDGDVARVRAIAAAAPGARFRLDANRCWPRDRVPALLAAYAGLPIDYVEEPCPAAHELLAERLAFPIALDESLVERLAFPGALDESLAECLAFPGTLDESLAELAAAPARPAADLQRLLRSPGLGALVLKPTLLGLVRCLELAALARAAGIPAIVTHALEGPIGTAACAELALALGGDLAVGLAPHSALDAWRTPVPQLGPAHVERAARPGLALDDDALTAALVALAAPTSSAPMSSAPIVVVALPSRETSGAIHAALDERRPIALLHPKLPAAEVARQRALVEAADLGGAAVVLFTSGSTGSARGVVIGRGALDAAAEASAAHLGWRDDDRWLLALSLAHAGGLAIVVRCRAANKPVVRVEPGDSLAERLAQATLASLVPTQLAELLADPAWRPAPHLRAVLLGGAAAPPALLEAAAARGVPFLTTYGMTESFGQVATAPLGRAGDPRAPLVALDGVALSAGTRDEPAPIRVRGPMLATRYLDGAPIAPELTTADLGFLEGGALHIVGRADDVIITGGENVHPQQVEAVLAATPGVRAACAFGIPDAHWGQLVAAALAVDPSFARREATARWHAALPPHARPRELALADALPTNANGKLDRRAAALLPRTAITY